MSRETAREIIVLLAAIIIASTLFSTCGPDGSVPCKRVPRFEMPLDGQLGGQPGGQPHGQPREQPAMEARQP